MKAQLTNYHQAPRKVRLVADLIRGKSVPAARLALSFLPKKSGPAFSKLLESAVANARHANDSIDTDALFVKTLTVNKGMTLKRMRPFKQGRAGRLHHIMSIVYLELADKPTKRAMKHVRMAKVAKAVTSDTVEVQSAKKTTTKKIAKPIRTTVKSGGKTTK